MHKELIYLETRYHFPLPRLPPSFPSYHHSRQFMPLCSSKPRIFVLLSLYTALPSLLTFLHLFLSLSFFCSSHHHLFTPRQVMQLFQDTFLPLSPPRFLPLLPSPLLSPCDNAPKTLRFSGLSADLEDDWSFDRVPPRRQSTLRRRRASPHLATPRLRLCTSVEEVTMATASSRVHCQSLRPRLLYYSSALFQ